MNTLLIQCQGDRLTRRILFKKGDTDTRLEVLQGYSRLQMQSKAFLMFVASTLRFAKSKRLSVCAIEHKTLLY